MLRAVLLSFILVGGLAAQSAFLTAPIGASDLVIPVGSTSSFAAISTPITINVDIGSSAQETIRICSDTSTQFNVCVDGFGGRGYNSTTARSHLANVGVALGACVGPCVTSNGPLIPNTNYIFTPLAPSGSLTATVPATITLSPVPPGVNGTDLYHWLYINTCSGGAQPVLITGGTAIAGAPSGTLQFTPSNSCTPGWTIESATAGVQEAIQTWLGGLNGTIAVLGANNTFAPIFPQGTGLKIDGFGKGQLINQTLASDTVTMNGSCLHCSIRNLTFLHQTAILSVSVNSSALTWTVASPLTPATPFYTYVGNDEIVQVTNISGITWTVVRGQLGTTGTAITAGATITLASAGADIDFTTTQSWQFEANNLRFYWGYRSIYMQVAPGTSSWSDIYSEAVNYRHIDAPANNGDQFTNFTGAYSVDDAIHVGPGAACIGSFVVTNGDIYKAGNDGVHIQGTNSGTLCQYITFTNVQSDSSSVNGFYVQNSEAITLTNIFGGNNAQNGIYWGPNSYGSVSQANFGGSGKEGLYVTNTGGAGSALNITNATFLNGGTLASSTYYGVNLTSTALNVNISGLQTGNVLITPQLGGMLIASGATGIHASGLQFPGLTAANYVSSAASNTDVVLSLPPTPFANLPASPQSAGMTLYCTTCTTASTCAGSGSGHTATSNGTVFTCN